MKDSFNLQGRTALVTGGSRGIGAAISAIMAEHGADIIMNYHADQDNAAKTRQDITAKGVKCLLWEADISRFTAPREITEWLSNHDVQPDILVLNASVQLRTQWDQVTAAAFEKQMNTNVRASLLLIQAVYRGMQARQWGRILTIGSVQQIRPHPEMIVYAASKNAQLSFVKSLAPSFANQGITINNLAPGAILTGRNEDVLQDESYKHLVESKIPAGFIGQPSDCAAAALLLCSDAGRYITGQNLGVDGGMSLCN